MTGGGLLFIQSHLLDWYIQNKTVWVGGSLNIWTADIFLYICVSETHFDVETQTISARQGVWCQKLLTTRSANVSPFFVEYVLSLRYLKVVIPL